MRIFAILFLLIASPAIAADTPHASPWRDFSEARVRLLLAPSDKAGAPMRAALEIRLAPGFKTYWRNPGDSGAPPIFDFTGSQGMEPVEVTFPFPERFDDGAGGQAIGYKNDVLLPFLIRQPSGKAPIWINLTLDFAVCGTMCIPLKANLNLDSRIKNTAPETQAAFDAAFHQVPKLLSAEDAAKTVQVRRLASSTHPLFLVSLSGRDWPRETTGFIDAAGHFALINRSRDQGNLDLLFEAHPAPGSGGRFGKARLTFGTNSDAYDVMINLDGAPLAP